MHVRRTLPSERWTMVMGNATALFAREQLLGPTRAGMIAGTSGGRALGLRASAVLLGIAAAIGLIKHRSEIADEEQQAHMHQAK